MAKIVCVLYDDPVDGIPTSYARDDLPKLDRYPGGQSLPTPKAIDFTPGALLGSVSGELGLRTYLESEGHTLIVTADKDGAERLSAPRVRAFASREARMTDTEMTDAEHAAEACRNARFLFLGERKRRGLLMRR